MPALLRGWPVGILDFFRNYYIPLRLVGRSAATVADYTSILRAADRPLADVSEVSTLSLLSQIRAKRSAATANKYRRTLVAVLRLAVKRVAMPAAPWLDDLPHYPEPMGLTGMVPPLQSVERFYFMALAVIILALVSWVRKLARQR